MNGFDPGDNVAKRFANMRAALVGEGHLHGCAVLSGFAVECHCPSVRSNVMRRLRPHMAGPGVVQDMTLKLHEARLIHSCVTCVHFRESTEGCALAGGARPPARVVAYGCPSWSDGEDDDIPF